MILTLKYVWLSRAPLVRGLHHLSRLLRDFEVYYNSYRGHTSLGGAVPAAIHHGEEWNKPAGSSRTPPANLERPVFADTYIAAYRLAA